MLNRNAARVWLAPWVFALFCLGAWWVQLQAELPPEKTSLAFALGAAGLSVLFISLLNKTKTAVALSAVMLAISCASIVAGFGYAAWRGQLAIQTHLPPSLEGQDLTLTGRVLEMPALFANGQRFRFLIENAQLANRPLKSLAGYEVMLSWYNYPQTVVPGTRYRFEARLKRRHGSQNPHGFDYERWLVEHGIAATGYVRSSAPQLEEAKAGGFFEQIEALRTVLRSRIFNLSPNSDDTKWIAALGLGDQRSLSDAIWQQYNATGVGHLLSVSGVHVTMLGGLLGFAFAAWWRRSAQRLLLIPAVRVRLAAICVGALLYALLSGWSLPAQRTVLMLWISAACLYLSGQRTPWHALSLAAFMTTLISPMAVASASFWLSFAAVAVLISLAAPYLPEVRPNDALLDTLQAENQKPPSAWAKFTAGALTASKTQLLLWLALLPISAVFFNQFSLVSPIANAIAIPLIASVTAPLALLAMVFSFIAPLAKALITIVGFLQNQVLAPILSALAAAPLATVALPAVAPWISALALGGIAGALLLKSRWRYGLWLSLAPYVYAAATASQLAPKTWEVWVMDVGQGTSVLIRSENKALLYDAGPRYNIDSDGAGRIVLPMQRGLGVSELDTVVLSHADEDHTGGALTLQQRIPVQRWLGSLRSEHALRKRLPAFAACPTGLLENWAGLKLEWLHPPASLDLQQAKTNAGSCVLRVSDGKTSVLLTGDIEAAQEASLVQTYGEQLKSTVLLAPHHGSNTSSTLPFLQAVKPDITVMQNGYRNRYGHPHPAVLARYAAENLTIRRTDFHGAVGFKITPQGYTVSRTREVNKRFWHTPLDVKNDQQAAPEPF